MRSDWGEQASVCVMRCAPPGGHRALERYSQNITGGHMHPDAGHLVLFSHGDWLLADNGYTYKMTEYENTALVNGIGQAGEDSVWLEDLDFRRGKPHPRILLAQPGEGIDRVVADPAPAYKREAGLKKFLRHVLYLKPSTWLIADEFETEQPSRFELLFHTLFPPQGDADTFLVRGGSGSLLVKSLFSENTDGRITKQKMRGASHTHEDREMDLLVLSNPERRRRKVFLTLLHAFPAGEETRVEGRVQEEGGRRIVSIRTPQGPHRFELRPERDAPSDPILRSL